MEILLTQLATGTCKNCGKPVSLLFDGHEQEWVHDDGEHRMERYCADSPKADPVEDAIERVKT